MKRLHVLWIALIITCTLPVYGNNKDAGLDFSDAKQPHTLKGNVKIETRTTDEPVITIHSDESIRTMDSVKKGILNGTQLRRTVRGFYSFDPSWEANLNDILRKQSGGRMVTVSLGGAKAEWAIERKTLNSIQLKKVTNGSSSSGSSRGPNPVVFAHKPGVTSAPVMMAFSGGSGTVSSAKTKTDLAVDAARKQAMSGALLKMNTAAYTPFDPDRTSNLEAIAHQQRVAGDRLITVFSDHAYTVTRQCSNQVFSYLSNDKLVGIVKLTSISFGVSQCMPFYPNKSYEYSYPQGRLTAIIIKIALHESFIFKPDGTLLTHCKGDFCYREDGMISVTRRSYISN